MPHSSHPGTATAWASVSRRQCLLAAAAVASHAKVQAHAGLGPLTPRRPAPPLNLTLHDGQVRGLPALLQGRITAVQLMFTSCTATCPIQGAVFAALQGLVRPALAGAQLLSITINPLVDDAAALAAWRQRLGAGPTWLAGAPPVRHAEVMLDFLDVRPATGQAGAGSDRHSPQVTLFDRQGRLAYRSAELASAHHLATAMQGLARAG